MEKLVPLRKLLLNPKKYGVLDAEKLYICYKPDENIAVFDSSKTGYEQIQTLRTKPQLKWHPIMHNESLYLVSEDSTHTFFVNGSKAKTTIGAILFEKGRELYSNAKIKAEGGFVTGNMTLSMPDWLKESKKGYLLASPPAKEGGYFSLEYMDEYSDLRTFLFARDMCFSLKPCAKLKKDTMVIFNKSGIYNGATPEKAIKISS